LDVLGCPISAPKWGHLAPFPAESKFSIASVDDSPVWGRAAAHVASETSRKSLSHNPPEDLPMAFTPSKDHKRREREQKKLDKRLAREDAKAENLAAQQAADEAAAEQAIKQAAINAQAKIEADFEAELAAEAAAERMSRIAC